MATANKNIILENSKVKSDLKDDKKNLYLLSKNPSKISE